MSIRSFSHTFRKAFITKFFRLQYSQFGEDAVIRELVSRKRDGFYVDVGCYHPKRFSNSYWLYLKGWRGINIDMEEHKIAMFKLARPGDVNVVAAISNEKEKLRIHRARENDLEARLVEPGDHGETSELTETTTLNDVLDSTKFRQRPIDVLSVDTEGYDLKVVQSLDWDTYKPTLVIVETHEEDIYSVLRSEINLFMESVGYVLRSWTVKSLIYVRRAGLASTSPR
jgi:FkbM family methyltransferase